MTLPAPRHLCQFDGSPFARANCTAASAAMALDAYTGGLIRVTPDQIRRAQSDQVGGIGVDDAAEAWRRWGQTLDVSRPSWSALVARLRAGDGAIVQGLYAKVPNAYAVQDSFDGGHAVYVVRIRELPNGSEIADVHDPLHPSGRIVWPVSVLKAYWDGLGPGGRAGWGHGVYVSPTAPTHRAIVARMRCRTGPNLSAPIVRTAALGALVRVEGASVGGAVYTLNGRRSDRWLRIVAVGSGRWAKRLPAPLYTAALGWERR